MNKIIVYFGLICLTLNCVLAKLFTDMSSFLISDCGSGAVTALIFGILIFIAVLLVIYKLKSRLFMIINGKHKSRIVCVILAAYFICDVIFVLFKYILILQDIGYSGIPYVILLLVIAVSVLFISLGDSFSIKRLCGFCIPIVIIGFVVFFIFGLKYCDDYNMMPILGNGVSNIIFSGIKNLIAFSGVLIPIVFICLTEKADEESFSSKMKCLVITAIIGSVIYGLIYSVFLLSVPPDYSEIVETTALNHISGFSGIGRLHTRLDVLNIIISVVSVTLYLSIVVFVIRNLVSKANISLQNAVKTLSAIVVIGLCSMMFSGCYGKDEVEDTAFAIAVGIDKSENDDEYIYTFQFSNPLSTGKNMNMGDEDKEEEEDDKNNSVNNISVECGDLISGVECVKRYIGKTPELSHIKLIVLSEDTADNMKKILGDFLSDRSVRAQTKVCMTDAISASEYLTSVNPSLEESTARYYELLFSDTSTSDTVQTDLRTLVIKLSSSTSGDAYMPLVTKSGFSGTILFPDNKTQLKLSCAESRLMNFALGNIDKGVYTLENFGTVTVKAKNKTKISTKISGDVVMAEIKLGDFVVTGDNVSTEASQIFKNELSSLIETVYESDCDILSVYKRVRTHFIFENDLHNFIQENNKKIDIII